ncbi:MAG: anti-sigma factor antagonist [Ruminococcus sp.]|nr:anti-sigma factor antagonist [Ruminococcus sp.]MBR0302469.1 anti-sigma factor antagonist [Clostridia bacterium]
MVDMTYKNDILTAGLYGEIDHHIAPKVRGEIDAKCESLRPKVLRLDFKAVTFMDSSGVGLVMGRQRCISLLGGRLEVVNIPKQIEKVFSLSGLGSLGVLK